MAEPEFELVRMHPTEPMSTTIVRGHGDHIRGLAARLAPDTRYYVTPSGDGDAMPCEFFRTQEDAVTSRRELGPDVLGARAATATILRDALTELSEGD